MAKKYSHVIGIDVGSQQIKIAEVKASGNQASVTALGMVATPPGAVDHTGLYDVDAVAVALKQVFASCGASAPAAVISIAGQSSVLVRTLEVPRMSPPELKSHMEWESTRNSPFAESTLFSDFGAFTPKDPAAQNQDVVMAIAPESAVMTLMSVFKKSGKKAAAIDVQALAIARSLTVSYGNDLAEKMVCVVDIGHKTTSINIFQNGQLLMPRQVPLGGEMFTQDIANAFSYPTEEAESLKVAKARIPESAGVGGGLDPFASTQGMQPYNPFHQDAAEFNSGLVTSVIQGADPNAALGGHYEKPVEEEVEVVEEVVSEPTAAQEDPEVVRMFNAFAATLEELVAEIRRSVDYFRGKGGDVNVIMLTGGGSKIPGLPHFLNRALGIETQMFDPLHNINLSAKRLEPSLLDQHRAEFTIAVGNGLHIVFG